MARPSATRRALLAMVLIATCGCSSPARPPDTAPANEPTSTATAGNDPSGAIGVDGFGWPETGWLRLDVALIMVDAGGDASATVVAVWAPGRVDLWIGPAQGDAQHRVEFGAAAAESVAALRGRFDASRDDGLTADGIGVFGGAAFGVVHRHLDTTVTERWEIGSGATSWGPDGPFGPRS